MKMYQFKNIVSTICTLIGIFCLVISVLCLKVWNDNMYGIISITLVAIYLIVGICAKIGADEDKEEYATMHKYVKEMYYDKLSVLYHKHFWKLDVDYMVPTMNKKLELLQWAVDVSMACKVYQHDYNTAKDDPELNKDLNEMCNLAQNLIDNKKYI